MNDFELMLFDRVTKIQEINHIYNLRDNAYLSFSGGKDSTVLHYLLDIALPNNKIPRLFLNTGIEYKAIREFVEELAKNNDRIIVYNVGVNIKEMLQRDGYPFKSKEHSQKVFEWKVRGERNKTLNRYWFENTRYSSPKCLRYQIQENFKLPISHLCCFNLKKNPAKKWAKENGKSIVLTGMRKSEGGQRASIGCTVFKNNKLKKFHPLLVVDEDFENLFIKNYNIKLCKLYYPPYNFKRSGCRGCPFNLNLRQDLETMKKLLPNEYKQCEIIWKPVYEEYRRLKYRLKKENNNER